MEYFEYLEKNDVIGVVAPSFGCGKEEYYRKRCSNAEKKLKQKNFDIKYSDSCFNNIYARSASAKVRAKEFEDFYFDENINGLISIAGGEFELEILPYINFEKIKKAKNKFFLGYSDNTCISFALATICDKASIYGINFLEFGMDNWHKSIDDCFKFLCGEKEIRQSSYSKIEGENFRKIEGRELEGYNLNIKSKPKILSNEKEINLKGRIIGGCLDILSHICGTKFDKVKEFCKKYKDDGIIWFFESCDLNIFEQARCIWKLKNAGWFDNAKGFLIGRPLNKETLFEYDYCMANYEHLKDFNVPVIIDLDIGHTNPKWFIVNGAIANFKMNSDNKAEIFFEFNE